MRKKPDRVIEVRYDYKIEKWRTGETYAVHPGLEPSMTWPQYLRCRVRMGMFLVELTPWQTELVLLLLLHRGRYVSTKDIIEWLWPEPDGGPDYATTTVYNSINEIKVKTGMEIKSMKQWGYCIDLPFQKSGYSVKKGKGPLKTGK